jgi:hypothetical protein
MRYSQIVESAEWHAVLRGRFGIEIHQQPCPLFNMKEAPWYSWTKKKKQVQETQGTKDVCDKLRKVVPNSYFVSDVHATKDGLSHTFKDQELTLNGNSDVFICPNPSRMPLANNVHAIGELKRLEEGKPKQLTDQDHNQVEAQFLTVQEISVDHPLGMFAFLTNCYHWWFYDSPGLHMRKFGPYSTQAALGILKLRLSALPGLPTDRAHVWDDETGPQDDQTGAEGDDVGAQDDQTDDDAGVLGDQTGAQDVQTGANDDRTGAQGERDQGTRKCDADDFDEDFEYLCTDFARPVHIVFAC